LRHVIVYFLEAIYFLCVDTFLSKSNPNNDLDL
jgi:hypothetical protein